MESSYIHGTFPEEQKRLSLLNEILNERCIKELSLTSERRVLDVGSGLGQFTKKIADCLSSDSYILGVERSLDQLKVAREIPAPASGAKLEFREGDALELSLKDDEVGSFDIAHTRFLLEHVPEPLSVVKEMVKAVRPGGRIVLEDDDHDTLRLWPEPPGLKEVWSALIRSYDRNGNDPFVGRRLIELLYDAGVSPVRNTIIFFGSSSGQENFESLVVNLSEILVGVKERLISQNLVRQPLFDACIEALSAWKKRQDAAFWYGVSWAEGRKE